MRLKNEFKNVLDLDLCKKKHIQFPDLFHCWLCSIPITVLSTTLDAHSGILPTIVGGCILSQVMINKQ